MAAYCGWDHAGVASSQCRKVYPDLHSLTPPPILILYLSLIPQSSKADRQLNKQRNLFREDTDRGKKLFCIYITQICNSRWQACLGGKYGPPLHTVSESMHRSCPDCALLWWEATCTRRDSHALFRNHVEPVNAFTRFWRSAFSVRIYAPQSVYFKAVVEAQICRFEEIFLVSVTCVVPYEWSCVSSHM